VSASDLNTSARLRLPPEIASAELQPGNNTGYGENITADISESMPACCCSTSSARFRAAIDSLAHTLWRSKLVVAP